jgi:hypothetical protein
MNWAGTLEIPSKIIESSITINELMIRTVLCIMIVRCFKTLSCTSDPLTLQNHLGVYQGSNKYIRIQLS